uniref:winged helix-turn-helix domain-containing protein n=1 Tax=Vibrio sp. V23_P3S9T160 TaxID=1938675 RepID=UPI00138225A6
ILDGMLEFRVTDSEFIYDKKIYQLAYTEARILDFLIKNNGNIVSKTQIIEYSWTGRVVAETSLAKSISNLRKVFRECHFHDDVIQTIPRLGYRLNLKSNIYEKKCDEARDFSVIENARVIGEGLDARAFIKYKSSSLNVRFKNIISYLVCFVLLFMSLATLYEVIYDRDSSFINVGYEEITINIEGKKYKIIKNKDLNIPSKIINLISLAPSGSLVFYDLTGSIISLSYNIGKHALSFTFRLEELDKAECVIKGAIEKEKYVCVL